MRQQALLSAWLKTLIVTLSGAANFSSHICDQFEALSQPFGASQHVYKILLRLKQIVLEQALSHCLGLSLCYCNAVQVQNNRSQAL